MIGFALPFESSVPFNNPAGSFYKSAARLAAVCALALLLALIASRARAELLLQEDMLGAVRTYTAKHDDTLLDLARNNGLGFVEIVAANQGIDPWVPGAGTAITLPTGHLLPDTPREGLIINLAEHRLYHFGPSGITTYAIGVGREGWDTPLGVTEIVRKKKNPIWYPPASIREEKPDLPKVVRAGPDNPLGKHALYFDWPTYLVHGTNMPWGVGRRVSHGCIRLYPEGIETLFSEIEVGTKVQVIDQPIKIGRFRGELYIEAYPEPDQVDELERDGHFESPAKRSNSDAYYKIRSDAGDDLSRLDWPAIRSALAERTGLPVRITLQEHAQNHAE
ncbi:MAG: L,D-transpeptidase family protein [Rhodospirillaceae bacterium]|nr:L,D-transpeptidase family protein [Rhodospirillaceae bacterium]MBT3627177.1 L,D-transpeptidase family protein [Rhodospirillaceae bacterium]MBT4428021.1 L,D-transpeptidase family protein [Rhodospirillaceae bacterium]MBT6829458.1 L,D-transpeptidase family protein [Rhodospirillaceae bacterium]